MKNVREFSVELNAHTVRFSILLFSTGTFATANSKGALHSQLIP